MAKAAIKKKLQFWGTGRRKKAIARVRLLPAGSGTIVINDRPLEDYFPQGMSSSSPSSRRAPKASTISS